MSLNRTHLILMTILSKSNAISPVSAITIEEIRQTCPFNKSYTTLHRAMSWLEKMGYISNGIKDGKFHTHYITENGKQIIKELI